MEHLFGHFFMRADAERSTKDCPASLHPVAVALPWGQTPCQLWHMNSPPHRKLPLDIGGESIPNRKDIKERSYGWRHLPFDIMMPACFPNSCKVNSCSIYFSFVSWSSAFTITSAVLEQLMSQVHGAQEKRTSWHTCGNITKPEGGCLEKCMLMLI